MIARADYPEQIEVLKKKQKGWEGQNGKMFDF